MDHHIEDLHPLKEEMGHRTEDLHPLKEDMGHHDEDLHPLKEDMAHHDGDLHPLKKGMVHRDEDLHPLKEDMGHRNEDLHPLKEEPHPRGGVHQGGGIPLQEGETPHQERETHHLGGGTHQQGRGIGQNPGHLQEKLIHLDIEGNMVDLDQGRHTQGIRSHGRRLRLSFPSLHAACSASKRIPPPPCVAARAGAGASPSELCLVMAAAAILRRRALPSSCRHDVYIRCLLSYSDLHSSVNSANLRFWRGCHNSGKIDLTDMTHPHLWYPNAREKKRKVFLHVGPTNSGKTHNALKRLEASSSGVYCGPLRLLAREVAKRLNEASVPCNLTTGQEREEIEGAKHNSVTVEMADVTTEYQCAVIDEIQMVGCRTRGFSFTRALLGLCSDELHVCGDPAAVPIIQRLLEATGDVVTVQYYERLSPLVPLKTTLGSFSNIKEGDCMVTFSRREIYKLKKKVEMAGKHLCSVVYGSLPPETRTKQATMFNDDSSHLNVLVASDAIGMGLNLNISRIIFSTLKKFDGVCIRELTVPEIKQIAGRAGRYGSKFPVGEVMCLHAEDLPLLHSSLKSPSPIIERAGLFPTFDLLSVYSRLQGTVFLHPILERFLEKAKLSPDYFIADCEDMLKVAVIVDELPLGLYDKYLFCQSPVDVNDDISTQGLTQFAENYAKKGIVRLKEIFTPGTLRVPKTHNQLKELESVHKVLELYVWLSYRFDDSFPDRELADSQKSICSMLIEEYLERSGWQQSGQRRALPSLRKLSQEYDAPQLSKYFPEIDARSK